MIRKMTALVLGLSVAGMAQAAPDNVSADQLAQSVVQLQKEVKLLKAELRAQKNRQKKLHKNKPATQAAAVQASAQSTVSVSSENQGIQDNTSWLPVDFSVPGRSFVSSGPYIGVPISYSGGHLIVNSPSVNQDFALLKLRYNIRKRLRELGVTESPAAAHLLLSGLVEGEAAYQTSGTGSYSSDINLTAAGIDAYILGPGQWLSGLIALSYDGSSGASTGAFASNDRSENSRVFVNQAFMTVGRLRLTPVYGTIGQLYVPFGTYSSNMVSSPLTKLLFRTKARPLVLGYQPLVDNTFYTAGYIFSGASHSGSASRVNNGGINAGFHFLSGGFSGDIGGGVIANIADSDGMQFVGNSAAQFNGFGGTNGTGNEQITHRVPAVDFRALVNMPANITLLAEYISAASAFSSNDLTQNTHGALPRALNAEAAYTFQTFSHPSSVAVGYGMSKDALALGLPAQRYSLVYNTSIWQDTLQSLEFRHDINYGAGETATGSGIAAAQANGRADNVITAQFDLYF